MEYPVEAESCQANDAGEHVAHDAGEEKGQCYDHEIGVVGLGW